MRCHSSLQRTVTALCVLHRCNVLDVESVRQVTHEISVSRLLCTTSTDKLIVRHRLPSPATMLAQRGLRYVFVRPDCSCDGYSLDPPMLYVVMEMCTGSLHGLLHGTPQITLTPAQRQQLAQQAAQGVAHLHTHALVHRQRHPLPDETHSVC